MIHLMSFLHTMSVYANRWGGPRYRTEELAKFMNKHLYNVQEDQLRAGEKVNTILAHDAFLGSKHTPLYISSIKAAGEAPTYLITDELGFEGLFAEGTEILVLKDDCIQYKKVEKLRTDDERVINFELVPEFNNDKLHHHKKHSENFISIKYENEYEKQMLLCDGLSSMTILKDESSVLKRVSQFNSENIQEIYFIKITGIIQIAPTQCYKAEFLPFSYSLKKNRELSDKSRHRYYKQRHSTSGRRWLEKMRSKVFHMKKDKIELKMELRHDEDRD